MAQVICPGLDEVVGLLRGRPFVALTGAGCSTESGIPDYRGPGTLQRARNPIQYGEFIRQEAARQRYWARSAVGWPRFRAHQPNEAHLALARLEREGSCAGVITQNVDELHTKAQSQRVVELHGVLSRARCLSCGQLEGRDALQQRLRDLNPGFDPEVLAYSPDGDAHLDPELTRGFRVPSCLRCAGVLKPDVVFFGENVPRQTLEAAWGLFDQGHALLVVGTSLTVYSGYRFVLEAAKRGMPVAMINLGATRGDAQVQARMDARASHALSLVTAALLGGQAP